MENGNASHQLNYNYDVYHSYESDASHSNYGPSLRRNFQDASHSNYGPSLRRNFQDASHSNYGPSLRRNFQDASHSNYGKSLRRNFQECLNVAMNNKGLSFVQNNEDLIRRNDNIPISSARIESMKESRILIVSISAKYASSVFSLNELVEILNCMKLRNQMVCPVFVQVDPSDLRYLRNSFGEAMAQHERRFGSNSEDLKQWMSALFEISNLSGWHLQTPGDTEAENFAEKVVRWITRSLNKYDVFLSFSGTDTRQFTGYLYNDLRDRFKTFMEDKGWVDGEELSQFHIQAIEESKFSIIVFSNNYADSSCRLDALFKILERKKLKKQQVFPIFYEVVPSVVRHQNGRFHLSMAIQENRFGKESEKVRNWKAALYEVANLKGREFEENEYVHKTTQEIVELVNKSLPRYDVFLSFRGQDTRKIFAGCLYYALCKKGFKTFMDDEELECGEQISQALKNAIQESQFAIIVFSENYAESSWCLDELVNILEWKRKKNQQVWAIYYKVKPSDVWYQRNSYDKAMEKHEKRFGKDSDKVRTWRAALSEVADLKNWQVDNGYEHKLIEQVVDKIIREVQGRTIRNTQVL